MQTTTQRSFEELGVPLREVTFCVLDLETTGISAASSEITEIGAIKVRGGEEIGAFQTLVNPGLPIPPFITILTGITHAMTVQAPDLETAFPSFLEFLGDAVIVGHNVRFDLSFLQAASARLDYGRLTNRWVDTNALARRLIPGETRNRKLATLAGHFGSPVIPNHRALEDTRATSHVFHCLLERAGTIGVTALEDLIELPKARGAAYYRKIKLTDDLPRRPGVYFFKDKDGATIYVGKAKNLRQRVRSYFYGDERRSIANLMRELETVEYEVCATELEAEVVELRHIHENHPRYNRRSRPAKASHFVKLTCEEFPRLSLVRTWREDGACYLGPFRSRRSAELVQSAIWDAVPIRRCTARPGSRESLCTPAQLGVAMCPCSGELEAGEYAKVVDLLIEGIERRPELLLEPLRAKVLAHANEERYEEAAWVRDRYQALARSIERRRSWQAMGMAGLVRLEHPESGGAIIDRGHLVAAYSPRGPVPLIPVFDPSGGWPPVPPTVLAAEEAYLIWRWAMNPNVQLVDSSNGLTMPAGKVPELRLTA